MIGSTQVVASFLDKHSMHYQHVSAWNIDVDMSDFILPVVVLKKQMTLGSADTITTACATLMYI